MNFGDVKIFNIFCIVLCVGGMCLVGVFVGFNGIKFTIIFLSRNRASSFRVYVLLLFMFFKM